MLLADIIKIIDNLKFIKDTLENTANTGVDIYSKKIIMIEYDQIFEVIKNLEQIDIKLDTETKEAFKEARELLNNY